MAEVRCEFSTIPINTPCPSCGFTTLFIGTGGHLTCSWIECKNPGVQTTIEALKAEVNRWKANHDNVVNIKRRLSKMYGERCREIAALRIDVERLTHLHDLDHKLADQWRDKNETLLAANDKLRAEIRSLRRDVLVAEASLTRAEFYQEHHSDVSYCHECHTTKRDERHEWDMDHWIFAEMQKKTLTKPDQEGDICSRCGCCSLFWQECDNCDEEGFVDHDCGEDTCCCLYPEQNVRCDICRGKRGWLWCIGHCDKNGFHGPAEPVGLAMKEDAEEAQKN